MRSLALRTAALRLRSSSCVCESMCRQRGKTASKDRERQSNLGVCKVATITVFAILAIFTHGRFEEGKSCRVQITVCNHVQESQLRFVMCKITPFTVCAAIIDIFAQCSLEKWIPAKERIHDSITTNKWYRELMQYYFSNLLPSK